MPSTSGSQVFGMRILSAAHEAALDFDTPRTTSPKAQKQKQVLLIVDRGALDAITFV